MQLKRKHTQEFKEIIQRLPDSYASSLVTGLLVFVGGLFLLGIIIRVPETVVAETRVTSSCPPIILKAKVSGKINLINKDLPLPFENDDYIAVIENTANKDDVLKIKHSLSIVNESNGIIPNDIILADNLSLGEIEPIYFKYKEYMNAYRYLIDDKNKYLYDIELLETQISNDSQNIEFLRTSLDNANTIRGINYNRYKTDSLLLGQKAILENDYNETYLTFLSASRQVIAIEGEIHNVKKTIAENSLRIESLKIQYLHLKKEYENKLAETYRQLVTAIKSWESNYVFSSPRKGIVEYANLITDGTFVTAGEPVFNVIYSDNKYIAIGMLPAVGAGKVKPGQKVNIKIDLYPYQEFGMLEGVVTSISLNTLDKFYLVYIDLPNGLISTNKTNMVFAETMYGKAEIITEKKRLISKIFYHLSNLVSGDGKSSLPKEKSDTNPLSEYQF